MTRRRHKAGLLPCAGTPFEQYNNEQEMRRRKKK